MIGGSRLVISEHFRAFAYQSGGMRLIHQLSYDIDIKLA